MSQKHKALHETSDACKKSVFQNLLSSIFFPVKYKRNKKKMKKVETIFCFEDSLTEKIKALVDRFHSELFFETT